MTKRILTFTLLLFGLLALSAGQQAIGSEDAPLVGKSPDQVISQVGVPDDVQASAGSLTFRYSGKDGASLRVGFHADVAVLVSGSDNGLRPRVPPKADVYLGMPVARAARLLGSCRSIATGNVSAELQ